jgi:soluble lytic murein transglycosylase
MALARTLLTAFLTVVCATFAGAALAEPDQPADPAEALAAAFKAMRNGDWDAAAVAAAPSGPIGQDLIEWHRLRAGRGSFDDTLAFLARRADWPGLPYLRQNSEPKLPYRRRMEEVLAFFADQPPRTGAGSVVYSAALDQLGRRAEAEEVVVNAWRTQRLSTGDEAYFLERYRTLLKPHHEARLDMLLWEGNASAAKRLLPYVSKGWQALATARMRLRDGKNGVDKLIAAVPAALKNDPGLAYERFQWRIQRGMDDSAVELILSRPATVEGLGRPGYWGGWRRFYARWAMREGDTDTAYLLASAHAMSEGDTYAELEWLAGYIALTYLEDPELALDHFRRFRIAVDSPISLGRAGYWEGRAHEAAGDAEAAAVAYAFGAEHQTSFYGQLAAERGGYEMSPDLTGAEPYPDWSTAAFTRSSVYQAALLLQAAGERRLTARFLAHLAETQDPVAMGQIAEAALTMGEPFATVIVAKRAVRYGAVLPRVYYPVIDLGVEDMPVPEELALAIARRESEFLEEAQSGVGALGLMQVMPPTAREMAGDLGLPYSRQRLLQDPVYNATLGTAYLEELIEMFGPNMALVAAAYNAGPGRAERWIRELGDPRSAGVDVIDWIEHIPFDETRNYIMRVVESLPVYRARLTGEVQPIRLSEELKAR